jgi:DHA1 family multidrug resistance protein-like MFS transporter
LTSPPVDWRRNLAALWFAQFTAIFGFSFAFPFLPVYLRELGVHNPSQLAIWTGLTAGASGVALAIMSPIWGALADRYGRRSMLLRAMIGGGIVVGLMGFARGPVDLLVLRLIQGSTSGTVTAATALVATGTPRSRVAYALGALSSAVAVGSAVGPLVGGLAASLIGVRAIFWAGGLLLIVATVPVLVVVREAPMVRSDGVRRSPREVFREAAAPGALGVVGALIVAQTLLTIANSGFQPMVVLRLLQHLSNGVAAVTGIAFAASGLASALAAVASSTVSRRLGFRRAAPLAALLLAAAQLFAGHGPGVIAIVAGTAMAGAFYGLLAPIVSSLTGLWSPSEVQARVFGFAASATAIGFAVGPLSSGLLAARLGVPQATTVTASVAVVLAALLAIRVREPVR